MEKMRVLIISMNGFGHISVGLGIADLLARHGHQSCFLLKKCFEDKITSKGHQFRSLESIHDEEPVDQAVNQMKFLESMLPKLKKPTVEQIESITEIGHLAEEHAKMNEAFENIIKTESFDLIITPTLLHLPAVEKSGIPWIYFHTLSPHLIYKEYIPPPFSGYSKDTDPETCQKFRDIWNSLHRKSAQHWIEYMARYGVGPTNCGLFSRESPYLNVYAYPRALDFHDVAPLPKNWFRMDNVVRQDDGSELNVPEEFLEREGKLIYLSLGSWFSGLVEVMKNLVDILRHSPHKFIVSRGPNYQKYELAENMWGERFLNQLKVLPIVDMVITHGGNNSTVECMYFGRPMIVLPCFVDQHDNAQRIDEKGFGVKLNPFKLDKTELLGTIEKILADTEMHKRCLEASNELKTSGTGDCVVKLFERIVADHKTEKDKKKEQDDIQIVQNKVSSVNLNGISNTNLLPTKSAA